MTVTASVLADHVTLNRSKKVLPNRLLKSAMTERLCTFSYDDHNSRGQPTEEYLQVYRDWSAGGIGTIVLGNIPVDRTGLEAKGNAIIDKRSTWDPVAAFKPVVDICKANGAVVIGQLTHGGRQVPDDVAPHPVSSSDVQNPPGMGMTFGKPRPMTIAEIDDLVDSFGFAAKVLYDAGADGVQLHAAHGYLLSQFLSARTNHRTDDYGGDLTNRSRIVFRIIDEIKKRVPDESFILSMKINSADFSDGGFTEEESAEIAVRLEAAGLDLIELSGGTFESEGLPQKRNSTMKREAFFIEFAEKIRPTLKSATLAVTGGFRSKAGMENAINTKACHIIGLGRPLCAEPFLCGDILSGAVPACKANLVDPPHQVAVAIAQIQAFGAKKKVPDLSDKAQAKEMEDLAIAEREGRV